LMRDKVKRNFVCVKIIKIKNIPKKEREATRIEVDLLRRLHHPNIVRYIDSFLSKNNESLCICMEYCDGGDLASQIKAARRNLFSESKILHWFVQLALGLHYMHGNKVLHRDLKTQNVFLLGNGRLVLGDLGISKVLDGTMDFAQTCIGTPYYMSPEIFKNKPYSFKSDIWALGCVLYEMTTLNHAFDANSLNGLATKIVKGKYPPIHAKYSKFLRELIGQMLLLNPQQRPDLDQILRKPFIKKHIINFFTDIASRPSASIGEGTMIMKAAAGGGIAPAASGVSNDTNMISLQKQLQLLNMNEELAEALRPKSLPVDDNEAIKLAKEQASALKREQEHKKMVESALEKLRLERENRLKEKKPDPSGPGLARPIGYPQPQGRGMPALAPVLAPVPSAAGIGGLGAGRQGVAGGQRPPQQPVQAPQPAGGGQGRAGAFDMAGGPARGNRRQQDDDNNSVNSRKSEHHQENNVGRRRSFDQNPPANNAAGAAAAGGAAVVAERERKQRLLQQQQQQELEAVKQRAEEQRRREEARLEARAREEARLREEARQREEAAKKSQVEFAARRDALAQREKDRERERERQKEEFEQLKRDKLELDRRATERDRLREERRAQERGRIEGGDKYSYMSEPPTSRSSNGNIRAEEKGMDPRDENASAKEKMGVRRQEKQTKEDAENENRKARAAAQGQNRYQYYATPEVVGKPVGGNVQPVSEDAKYEFDPRKPKNRVSMDVGELNDRLSDITKGKSRFDNGEPEIMRPGNAFDAEENPRSSKMDPLSAAVSVKSNAASALAGSDTGSDEDEEAPWIDKAINGHAECNMEDEVEDLHKREEELKAELNFSTFRVNELKKTLEVTKSFIKDRAPTRGNPLNPLGSLEPYKGSIADRKPNYGHDSEFDEEESILDEDEDYDLQEADEVEDALSDDGAAGSGSSKSHPQGSYGYGIADPKHQQQDTTIRRLRSPVQSKVHDRNPPLQDMMQPSPSGRLSDRIERLRLRCTEALGRDAFTDAYNFLKQHEEDSQGYDNGRDMNDEDYEARKVLRLRAILGEQKVHYGSLIEQLIFMEETHRP